LINESDKIYARKCDIREISPKEKNKFLNEFHIQGEDKLKIKLGAFYNDQLVGVMTFGSLRIALGSINENEFELIRFATSCQIIGLASKMLKYFVKIYKPDKIISFADRRWTFSKDNLYEKLGFKKISNGNPNYWYIDKNNGQRIHRFNFRKNILEEKLDFFDKNLTEWENMQLNSFDRIWDCGNLKYELNF